MKHKFLFSGKDVDLDQNVDVVKNAMQTALNRFFPTPNFFAKVGEYKEIDAHSFEMTVVRQYCDSDAMALGNDWICDQDASLLTGLDISAFQPFEGKALIAPVVPWYDNKVYTPKSEFVKLWKHQNKVMASEAIKDITVTPWPNEITVTVKYDDGTGKKKGAASVPRRYKDDIDHLTAFYGDLNAVPGHRIESTLQDFVKICPRDQLKVAAYQGLASYLQKHYGLTLHLTSRKSKGDPSSTQAESGEKGGSQIG